MRRIIRDLFLAILIVLFTVGVFAAVLGGRNGEEFNTTLRTAINPTAAVAIAGEQTEQHRLDTESADRRAAERQQTLRYAIGAVVAIIALAVMGRTVPAIVPLLLPRPGIIMHAPPSLPADEVEAHWRLVDREMAAKGYLADDSRKTNRG